MSESKIKFTVYPNAPVPFKMPYKYVIPATQENIDVRLGSIGLPALASLSKVQQLFLTLFLKGRCLCVREVPQGVEISIKSNFKGNTY